MHSDYETILRQVFRRGGFAERGQAEGALLAAAEVLGQRLHSRDSETLADELPEPLAGRVRASGYQGDFSVGELVERVRAAENVAPGFAREHALVVGEAIGRAISRDTRHWLLRVLGDEWRPVLEPDEARATRAVHAPPGGRRPILAEGRAGSRHPLSDSAPPEGQRDSVAASDDPHDDDRLSSAHRLRGESLSGGRPGSRTPLSGEER